LTVIKVKIYIMYIAIMSGLSTVVLAVYIKNLDALQPSEAEAPPVTHWASIIIIVELQVESDVFSGKLSPVYRRLIVPVNAWTDVDDKCISIHKLPVFS